MNARAVRIVRRAQARACCEQLERVELYTRRAGGRLEQVFAMVCPVHGPDGRVPARAAAARRPLGIVAFKHRELPRRA